MPHYIRRLNDAYSRIFVDLSVARMRCYRRVIERRQRLAMTANEGRRRAAALRSILCHLPC